MDIFATVFTRLTALGYTVAGADDVAIRYNIEKAELILKTKTNLHEIPTELFYIWVDMAAGMFLADKKAAGALSEQYDFSAPAKSISEGDTSVSFAIADTGSTEDQFDTMISKMIHPNEETILAYRRLQW